MWISIKAAAESEGPLNPFVCVLTTITNEKPSESRANDDPLIMI